MSTNNEFDFVMESLKTKKDQGEDIQIPETVNNDLYADEITPKEEPKKTARKKKSISYDVDTKPVPVDASEIKIVEKNALEKNRIVNSLYSHKPEFQIIASQSAYNATITPLVNADILSLMNSSVSWYNYQKNIYKIIFEKLGNLPGQLNFDQWCKITSVEDIETFFYGLFCSTFPEDGTISIDCPECGNLTQIKINCSQLSQVDDAKSFKKRKDDISKNVVTMEDVKVRTMLFNTISYKLPESGVILKLKTPSLYDHLEILRTISEDVLSKNEMATTQLLYIDSLLIPDSDGYYIENGRVTILGLIDRMSITDAKYLRSAIQQRIEENKISFSIKNVKCPDCEYVHERIPVSMQDILFTAISERV